MNLRGVHLFSSLAKFCEWTVVASARRNKLLSNAQPNVIGISFYNIDCAVDRENAETCAYLSPV